MQRFTQGLAMGPNLCTLMPRTFKAGRQLPGARQTACQAAQPFVLVGSGRVGNALREMGTEDDKVIKRGEPVDGPDGPIIVCTRNDDLQGVIDMTPKERREDLVFIQNGMLQPYLEEQGLGDNTQALIYFAVAKYGEAPTDGTTDANPEGLTSVCGKHADAVAARLKSADLTCHILDKDAYRKSMIEKLAWICALMLVGERNGGINVGEVESSHRDEVEPLIEELVKAGCADMGVSPKEGFTERLMAYSRSVAHFPTAVKELPWRNGFFLDLSKQAEQKGQADPCPLHSKMMSEIGKA